MNNDTSELTGRYYNDLISKVTKIEKKAKPDRIRKVMMLVLILSLCGGGIYYGRLNKEKELNQQYERYVETEDVSCLTKELVAYKDTYSIFEKGSLGNSPYQSMMGGYFFSNENCSVYPNEDGKKTILEYNGEKSVLCEHLADNINVRNDVIYYRDPSKRIVYEYDIPTGRTTPLEISGSGQFVVCGDEFYYIDINDASLIRYNNILKTTENVIDEKIISFVIAGENIIYLSKDHVLKSFDLNSCSYAEIASNISAFSYNGMLWFQNDQSLYKKQLDTDEFIKVETGINCDRLLGVTDTLEFIESSNQIHVLGENRNRVLYVSEKVFVAASNNRALLFSTDENCYKIVEY